MRHCARRQSRQVGPGKAARHDTNGWERIGRRYHAHARILSLEAFDQAGVDQQAIEAARLRAASAVVEPAIAALEYLLLLDERRIERQARAFLDDQGEIRPLDGRRY